MAFTGKGKESVTKVSWVQPNFKQGPKEVNAYYLPYSAGVIWSYAVTDPEIKENFELGEMIFRRDPIDQVVQKLADSDIIAFSTYVWNHQYNYTIARELKKVNPNCVIIFGGPEVAVEDKDLFVNEPFMDIVIKHEGEITFKNILKKYGTREWHDIPGLLINDCDEVIDTGPATRIEDLEQLPSPYLTGVFDKIIKDNPDVEWNATLETNRGCPFACTFCDWGSLTYNKVKQFHLERVFAELDWIGQHRCGFISITDANFGMFPYRDSLIADKIIEIQHKYGYPKSLSVAWAKNQKQEVVGIVKKLLDSPAFNQGLTLSVQSLDLDVLENIRRRNMEINRLEEIFELCEQRNIPVYTELILGLPGETLDSWKENYWRLFRMGNHTGITVNQAQLLENAEMNLLQKKLYKITDIPVYDYFPGTYSNETIEECIKIVTGTKDMPFDVMVEAQLFSWFVNTLHINGISTLLARLVHKHLDIDYEQFYSELFEFLKTDPWWAKEQTEVEGYLRSWMAKGRITHPPLGGIEIHGWNLTHRTVLNIHIENQYDHVFGLLSKFMERYNLDQDLFDDVIKFQRNYMIAYDNISKYPMKLDLNHNLWEYLVLSNSNLQKNSAEYILEFPEDKSMTFQRFLELYYFSRRRNFGKATVESNQ